jgi:hypothetical protein
MGCSSSNIIEVNKKLFSNSENYIVNKTKGILNKNSQFIDCLITNKEELEEKLIDFIPTRIKIDNKEDQYNIDDNIITKSFEFNFDENYLIALNGLNDVLKVEEKGGNYLIYHDNIPANPENYICVVVKQIIGTPQISFNEKKPELINNNGKS